jgi:hypothetical protein
MPCLLRVLLNPLNELTKEVWLCSNFLFLKIFCTSLVKKWNQECKLRIYFFTKPQLFGLGYRKTRIEEFYQKPQLFGANCLWDSKSHSLVRLTLFQQVMCHVVEEAVLSVFLQTKYELDILELIKWFHIFFVFFSKIGRKFKLVGTGYQKHLLCHVTPNLWSLDCIFCPLYKHEWKSV